MNRLLLKKLVVNQVKNSTAFYISDYWLDDRGIRVPRLGRVKNFNFCFKETTFLPPCIKKFIMLFTRAHQCPHHQTISERTISTERPPLVGEVSGKRNGSPRSYSRLSRPELLSFLSSSSSLYSWGWVDPVPGPLLSEDLAAQGIEPRTSGYLARNSDY
jgi:hypothetical protein